MEGEGSLIPFFFGVGVATGIAGSILVSHPAFTVPFQTVVILGDMGIYSFFTWLFWDDMRLQFRNRLKKFRGTVGFRWQRADHPELSQSSDISAYHK